MTNITPYLPIYSHHLYHKIGIIKYIIIGIAVANQVCQFCDNQKHFHHVENCTKPYRFNWKYSLT